MLPRHRMLVLALVASAALPAAAATTISDARRELSFTLPDGYVESPGGTREPKLGLAFARGEMEKPGYAILQVVSLGGTIGRGKLDPTAVEKAARDSVRGSGVELGKFEYRRTKWQGLEVDLLVAHAKRDGHDIVTVSTQVPLAKEAIQLNLAGSADEQARLFADLQSVLGSLKGKSNWLTDEQRSEQIGRSVGTVASAVGGAILILVLLRRARRKAAG
jgi:hypothetical protein